MKTNTNSLTEIQIKAIKNSILSSMRKSLSGTPLAYDVAFEQKTNMIADSIIEESQKILAKSSQKLALVNKKKNARK